MLWRVVVGGLGPPIPQALWLRLLLALVGCSHRPNGAPAGCPTRLNRACAPRMMDYNDRRVSILFGDGAGAAVVTADEDTRRGCLWQMTEGDEDLPLHGRL